MKGDMTSYDIWHGQRQEDRVDMEVGCLCPGPLMSDEIGGRERK
jgi:hypothetical protein